RSPTTTVPWPPPSTASSADRAAVTTTVGRPRTRGAEKFPGGRVVTGCFIVLAVSSGLGFYGLAVYLAAFSDEQGWPVAEISLATTLYLIVGGAPGRTVPALVA